MILSEANTTANVKVMLNANQLLLHVLAQVLGVWLKPYLAKIVHCMGQSSLLDLHPAPIVCMPLAFISQAGTEV